MKFAMPRMGKRTALGNHQQRGDGFGDLFDHLSRGFADELRPPVAAFFA